MTKHHKRILEQGGLLDDLVIYAALMLLRDQFPTMSGFQPTVLCQVKWLQTNEYRWYVVIT